MKRLLRCFATALTFLVVGCASSVQLASPSLDESAKRFEPVSGKTVVYVIEDNGVGAHRAFFQVHVNGQYAAAISGNTFCRLVFEPGRMRVIVSSPENQEAVNLNGKAGDVIYLASTSYGGWAQMRVKPLRQLPADEGKRAVLEGKLAHPVD